MTSEKTNYGVDTKLAAIIGNPVAQSLSPVIHNAVFHAMNLNWMYLAFRVESPKLRNALEAMSALGISGFSVTMPHKNKVAEIIAEIGEVDSVVAKTKSANTVILRDDQTLFATNTDGDGCCNAIEANTTQLIKDSRVVVLGAGGTASAVVHSLIARGALEVVVVNRTPERANTLVQSVGNHCRVALPSDLANEVEQAAIVINTTPVGFDPHGSSRASANESPIDVRLLTSRHVVLDAVYRPLMTPLLVGAKNNGAQIVDGLEMLVHQAALQQQLWLGRAGNTVLMREAALASL